MGPRYLGRLRRTVREFRPDVLHTNGLKMHLLGAWTVLPFLELGGDLQVTFAQGDNFQAIAGDFPPYNTDWITTFDPDSK